MRIAALASLIHVLLLSAAADAEVHNRWAMEMLLGGAYCIDTPLTIDQSDFERIELTAKYRTNSLEHPIYYSLRLSRINGSRAWELELIHLKIELKNRPIEVQHFEITHGYNMLTLNRVWFLKMIDLRLGCGILLLHPENTVRERKLLENEGLFGKGYYISGPTAQLCLGRNYRIHRSIRGIIEAKFSAAYGRVPVEDGHAVVPNFAIHGLLGLGYRF